MITLWFKPAESYNKSKMIEALKKSAHISLADAREAVEIQRVTFEPQYRDDVSDAIYKAGGKLV